MRFVVRNLCISSHWVLGPGPSFRPITPYLDFWLPGLVLRPNRYCFEATIRGQTFLSYFLTVLSRCCNSTNGFLFPVKLAVEVCFLRWSQLCCTRLRRGPRHCAKRHFPDFVVQTTFLPKVTFSHLVLVVYINVIDGSAYKYTKSVILSLES